MKNKDLIIKICGRTASGKSRVLFLLKKFLRENGFEVQHDQTYDADYQTEADFDLAMGKHYDEVIDSIKQTRKIILSEMPLISKPIINNNKYTN